MKTVESKKRFLLNSLFLCFFILLSSFSFAVPASCPIKISESMNNSFYKLGTIVIEKFKGLSHYLNSKKQINFTIKSSFYDYKYKRVFVEFIGILNVSKSFPIDYAKKAVFLTTDGNIAYDVFATQVSSAPESIKYAFNGTLVLSLDLIILELAKQSTLFKGFMENDEIINGLSQFIEAINIELLANSLSQTLTEFSKDSFIKLYEVIKHHFSENGNTRIADLLLTGFNNTSISSFFAATLVKFGLKKGASLGGATLGALIGGILTSGGTVGLIIGGFIGTEFAVAAANTIVFEITTNMPLVILIDRIAQSSEALLKDPSNQVEIEKNTFNTKKMIVTLHETLSKNDYSIFDLVMAKIERFPESKRVLFINLLFKIRELLRFKLIDKEDWYTAKKILQFREMLKRWKLQDRFLY
ncbi:MAG: glycine zipper family protein [Candidatus Riflebacteria bacterium]|nr:glycine zipper family protein [Candidatus Riflebacteria bacterium]